MTQPSDTKRPRRSGSKRDTAYLARFSMPTSEIVTLASTSFRRRDSTYKPLDDIQPTKAVDEKFSEIRKVGKTISRVLGDALKRVSDVDSKRDFRKALSPSIKVVSRPFPVGSSPPHSDQRRASSSFTPSRNRTDPTQSGLGISVFKEDQDETEPYQRLSIELQHLISPTKHHSLHDRNSDSSTVHLSHFPLPPRLIVIAARPALETVVRLEDLTLDPESASPARLSISASLEGKVIAVQEENSELEHEQEKDVDMAMPIGPPLFKVSDDKSYWVTGEPNKLAGYPHESLV